MRALGRRAPPRTCCVVNPLRTDQVNGHICCRARGESAVLGKFIKRRTSWDFRFAAVDRAIVDFGTYNHEDHPLRITRNSRKPAPIISLVIVRVP